MHAAHALCGLFHPMCALSLTKAGNEDIVLCCGYRAFTNIRWTCSSLTTREQVGLRFDPRWSRPTTIAGNEERDRRKGTKTGNEGKEPRQGIKKGNDDGNEGSERRQGTEIGNQRKGTKTGNAGNKDREPRHVTKTKKYDRERRLRAENRE